MRANPFHVLAVFTAQTFRKTAGGGGGDEGRPMNLFSQCEKMVQYLSVNYELAFYLFSFCTDCPSLYQTGSNVRISFFYIGFSIYMGRIIYHSDGPHAWKLLNQKNGPPRKFMMGHFEVGQQARLN